MAAGTGIEWTEVTWNPTTGCDQISAGCDNCYALTLAKRLKAMGQAKYQNDGDPRTSGPGFGLTVHWGVAAAVCLVRAPGRVRQLDERPFWQGNDLETRIAAAQRA
jgi:protein gp37